MSESKKWEILSLTTIGMVGVYLFIKRNFLDHKSIEDQIKSQIPTKPDEVLSIADDDNISHQMRNTKKTQLDLNRGKSSFARKQDNCRKKFKVFKVCITGGPCAGKTTGMAFVAERLRERGFRVFNVPEAATLIAGGGGMIKTHEYTESDAIAFQTTLLETQIHLEDSFMELAYLAKDDAEDAVVLTDRGLMDGSAYMRPESWQALLDEKGLSEINLRDRRYDAVIHMVTAADGAEEYYNLNNAARYESSLEMAITVDRNIQNAWIGHHYRIIIENKTKTFEEKMQKLFESCCRVIGIPKEKDASYRRFLLNRLVDLPKHLKTQIFHIEDTYVKVDEDLHFIIKIRKRGQSGLNTYTLSEITRPEDKNKQNISTKRQLSPREYVSFLQQADPTRLTLLKDRICFTDGGRSYIIDTFKNVKGGFTILRVEIDNHSGHPSFPDFLKDLIVRDVTSEKGYSSLILSRKMWLIPEADLGYFENY